MSYGVETKLEWSEERLRNEKEKIAGVNIFFSSSLWSREERILEGYEDKKSLKGFQIIIFFV